ncbi:lantibiotic dehydratase [Dyadobacter chenwenxiniae]|uniref:Lantibiotic dehydratase n=1 Tax=Dyadobacter chenwenxiniae TaxID=2906456 RepID=A0A9X1PNI3_9BACT|nr:lantibiotic dehydratase [Dyadobacter chenwenxiniae]MCF0064410.1 lantibiotic dehydratase [Dyadobacter chenwenxiniae]UON82384.1 lantibiotic dehydratase [Dyadobacter chenwenxiniae]
MDVRHQLKIAPFDFSVIRRPNFPVNLLLEVGGNSRRETSVYLELFKKFIRKEPEFLKAIYIASPALCERTRKWIDGEIISEEESLLKTLYKYWGRICTRPTPYGLFSGVALASWGEQTSIEVDKVNDQIFVDLDILIINRLAELALLDDCVKENILFFANNSIYKVGNGFRYVEYVVDQGRREYFLSFIRNFEALESVLAMARNGCYLSEIKQGLVSRGYSVSASEECVSDLIELKIIQNEFEAQITGGNGLIMLIDKLRKSKADSCFLSHLEQIAISLNSDKQLSIKSLKTVKDLVDNLLSTTTESVLVQLTLQQKYKSAQIGRATINRIEKDLTQIAPLFGNRSRAALTKFKKQFTEKYGEAEMPLSIILDGELGIDYGDSSRLSSTQVLDGVELVPIEGNHREFSDWDHFLLSIYLRYSEEKSDYISLTRSDFKSFSFVPDPPPSFYAIGNLFQDGKEKDIKFNLNYVGGNSGITLLSRFSSSNEELKERLLEIADHEQNSYQDAVLAEIIFSPESRTGNVLSHPPFYPYEIPFITRSSAPERYQLPINDLTVSVKEGKQIILRSKKLGKQVIPRLSNAHNYDSELPVYRFLCDIQTDSTDINFSWNWSFLEDRPVLPRVVFNSLIMSRKTWNINAIWAGRVDEFISLYNVPRYVQLVDRDNEMLLDLHLPLARSILADELKKKGKTELKEFLSMPEQCVVGDQNENKYANELIIPFKTIDFHMKSLEPGYVAENVIRKFVPGDDWLYVKIYSGPTILDKILIDIIGQLANELVEEGTIDRWFFVRFRDPFHHLRLRFYKPAYPQFAGAVLDTLKLGLSQMRNHDMIERFVIDTYDRELERYGSDTIETAEKIFFVDSSLVINVLSEISERKLDEIRWLYACLGVHATLEAFGLDLKQKLALITTSFESFLGEYQHTAKLRVQLNHKFRSSRLDITGLIEQYENSSGDGIVKLFLHYAVEIKQLLISTGDEFSTTQIRAFLHMFCNRFLIDESRGQELLIYHSLSKFYDGRNAREEKTRSRS